MLGLDLSIAGILVAVCLILVAAIYLAMAFGVRSGELIWGGRHVGRLPGEQRVWSFLYGLSLLASALVILELSDAMTTGLVPSETLMSAGFAVTSLLGLATVTALARGSRWERWAFAPVTLVGAGLAGWLIF